VRRRGRRRRGGGNAASRADAGDAAAERRLRHERGPLRSVRHGAQDRASPSFVGLARLALNIGVFCGFLYSMLLFNAISGLDCLGLALSRPQVQHPPTRQAVLRRAAGRERCAIIIVPLYMENLYRPCYSYSSPRSRHQRWRLATSGRCSGARRRSSHSGRRPPRRRWPSPCATSRPPGWSPTTTRITTSRTTGAATRAWTRTAPRPSTAARARRSPTARAAISAPGARSRSTCRAARSRTRGPSSARRSRSVVAHPFTTQIKSPQNPHQIYG
jgi:hypothetical protein